MKASTHNSSKQTVQLHMDEAGLVWFSGPKRRVKPTDLPATQILAHPVISDSSCIRVLGSHPNAELLKTLYQAKISKATCFGFANKKIQIGTPSICSRDALKYPELAMQSTPWLANRPPSVGGWHEMSSREFPVYSMVAEYHKAGRVNGSVMKHLRYHPAWPALSFLGSPNLRDGAEVLCDIVDPRWFLSPKKPNRWSRLFEFFGLNPVTMQFLVSEEKRGKCRHLDRAKTCIRCWTGEKKPPPGIRNLPPQLFLWAAFRSINQDKDSWKALRAASRKFLLFLTTSWLDEMHPSRELFVPEYFFQNRRQAKAFRKHRRENRPRLA